MMPGTLQSISHLLLYGTPLTAGNTREYTDVHIIITSDTQAIIWERN